MPSLVSLIPILMKRKRNCKRLRRIRGGKQEKTIAAASVEQLEEEYPKNIAAAASAAAEQLEEEYPNVPEEILVQILSSLPPTSLARFTCVSKQWFSYVKTNTVRSNSSTNQKVLVMVNHVHSRAKELELQVYSIDQDGFVETVPEPEPRIRLVSDWDVEIFGSCNGLLLLRHSEDLFLWNPLTRFFKKVLSYEPLGDDFYEIVSGLCYDSTTDEYKAVLAFRDPSMTPGFSSYFTRVGSLRSKLWREIPSPYDDVSSGGPLLHENLHWVASEDSDTVAHATHRIIYFKPRDNKFEVLPMPPYPNDGPYVKHGLGVLDGCLCMVRQPYGYQGLNVDILTMKEYGKGESWTTMFTISDSIGNISHYDRFVPLCFTKNGDFLMKIVGGIKMVKFMAYNLKGKSHRDVAIPIHNSADVRNLADYDNEIVYEESWVAPIDYNWEKEEEEEAGKAVCEELLLPNLDCGSEQTSSSSETDVEVELDCDVEEELDCDSEETSSSSETDVEVEDELIEWIS